MLPGCSCAPRYLKAGSAAAHAARHVSQSYSSLLYPASTQAGLRSRKDMLYQAVYEEVKSAPLCKWPLTATLNRVDELVLQGAHGDVRPLRHVEDLMRQAALWAARLLHLHSVVPLGILKEPQPFHSILQSFPR